MNPLLAIILKDIVAPELLAFIKSKLDSTGQLPTLEEIQSEIEQNLGKYIKQGQEFVDRP